MGAPGGAAHALAFARRVFKALTVLVSTVAALGTAQAADVVSATVVRDRAFNAKVGTLQTRVSDLVVQPDGKLVVTGGFNSPNRRLSRFNADGSPDEAFNTNVGTVLDGTPNALALQPDGKIVVVGFFSTPARNVARFNADGTPDTVFNSSFGTPITSNQIWNVAVQPDGKILVSGDFASASGGAPSNSLARFNADGSPDTDFNANIGTRIDNVARDIAVQADGKIVLVGLFTQPNRFVARFNSDGSSDGAFNSNVRNAFFGNGNGGGFETFAVRLQSDGKIVVGGNFGQPTKYLARLNTDGSSDTTFNANVRATTINNAVTSIALQSNGNVVVGGSFTTPVARIARFNANGTADTTFNTALSTGLATGFTIASVSTLPDGKIVAVGGKAFPPPVAGFIARYMPPCGPGIALTTSPVALWQQLALPCKPTATAGKLTDVLGGNVDGQLDATTYLKDWVVYQRNADNNGNVQMALETNFSAGTGHWIKSLVAPVGGKIKIDETNSVANAPAAVTGCESTATEGCVVVNVNVPSPTATAGPRMLANPFPHDVDWSKVKVRVGGVGGAVYTPSQAAALAVNVLSNQIWIWNGNDYVTSDDATSKGNLQYFKSFFVKVLPGGVGQTIDLLIPALASTITSSPSTLVASTPAALAIPDSDASLARSSPTSRNARSPQRRDWLVDLTVRNTSTGWNASAKLGQWPGTDAGYDAADLSAMSPFAQPYLTVVFPRPEWAGRAGDYATDLRPANGWASKWDFEVRAEPLNSNVVVRWNTTPAILAKSRLIDRDTGAVVYPSDPNFATGYPMTMNTKVRRLTWEYMGN